MIYTVTFFTPEYHHHCFLKILAHLRSLCLLVESWVLPECWKRFFLQEKDSWIEKWLSYQIWSYVLCLPVTTSFSSESTSVKSALTARHPVDQVVNFNSWRVEDRRIWPAGVTCPHQPSTGGSAWPHWGKWIVRKTEAQSPPFTVPVVDTSFDQYQLSLP